MIKETLARLLDGHDLEQDEARRVMGSIMDGDATPAQIGGFLVALRLKGETADEIAGCAEAMREHVLAVRPRRDDLVDTAGTGGDGARTFNISTAAALVAAAAGAGVAKHGNRAVSSSSGSADVLEALGFSLELPPERIERSIDELGFGFLFAPTHHPAMRHAAPVRRELAARTVFNVLGPLTNPAGARAAVVGVYAPELVPTIADVLLRLGATRAFVVHGAGGVDELSPAIAIAGRDARVDGARRRIGNALHDREVVALETMFLEELAPGGVRVFRERDGQRARGVAIEAMQHADVRLVPQLEFHVLAHAAKHGVFGFAGFGARGNRQQAGGLVEDDDLVVFVEDVEGRPRPGLRGPVAVQIDDGVAGHVEAGITLNPAIDGDLPFFNRLADLPPREIWLFGLQPFVEAHASAVYFARSGTNTVALPRAISSTDGLPPVLAFRALRTSSAVRTGLPLTC